MTQIVQSVFPVELFTQLFMFHAFLSSTIVAIVSGVAGFFVILRRSSFVVHVLPKSGFAGAAGAVWIHISPLIGLIASSLAGAFCIGFLNKRGRHDVNTALTLIASLGLGALFLALNPSYATGAYAMLFGQLVGVSSQRVVYTAILGMISLLAIVCLYRPLLFTSILKENAKARGIKIISVDITFMGVVGLVVALTVPEVGALLSFSLMIGPAATSRYLVNQPAKVICYSVTIAVLSVWMSLILAYDTGWPIGFFVSTITVLLYGGVRKTHVGSHRFVR